MYPRSIHFLGANPPAWKVKAQMPNGPQAAPTPTVSASGPSELRTKSGKNEFNPVQPIIRNALNAHDSCCNEKPGKKSIPENVFSHICCVSSLVGSVQLCFSSWLPLTACNWKSSDATFEDGFRDLDVDLLDSFCLSPPNINPGRAKYANIFLLIS